MEEGQASDDNFYIVLSGQVGVITKRRDFFNKNLMRRPTIEQIATLASSSVLKTSSSPEIQKIKNKFLQKSSGSKIFRRGGTGTFSFENADLQEKIGQFGVLQNTLDPGESFGEKALVDPTLPRSATIIAITDVEVLVLSRDDFLSISGRFDKEKNQKNSFLLKFVPFLDKINATTIIENLLSMFKDQTVSININSNILKISVFIKKLFII